MIFPMCTKLNYSLILTSCGRFDLLRQTVESFLVHADVSCIKFVVVEDSGDESVRDVLAGFDAPFELVINRPMLGQAAAIDAGYAQVKTLLVFHCADDWEFLCTGFISGCRIIGGVYILLQRLAQKMLNFMPKAQTLEYIITDAWAWEKSLQ